MLFIEELHLYANAKIAKVLASIVVVFFIIYHGILHAIHGSDTCHHLLSNGRFQGSLVWQPYGCMIHSYSDVDTRRCMRYVAFLKENNRLVFLGDSRTRELYYGFLDKLSENHPKSKMKKDLSFNDTNLLLDVQFFWRPTIDEKVEEYFQKLLSKKKKTSMPKLIVMESGLETIRDSKFPEKDYEEYRKNLTSMAPILGRIGNRTHVLWMLLDPIIPSRLDSSQTNMTNEWIDMYNKAAIEIFSGTPVILWSSSRLIAEKMVYASGDGMHVGHLTVNYYIQILLNFYCNNHLNYNDGTCCNSREGFTLTQMTVFTLLCICSILMIAFALKKWLCATKSSGSSQDHNAVHNLRMRNPSWSETEAFIDVNHSPKMQSMVTPASQSRNLEPTHQEVLMAIGKLGLIVGYFFLCDRTNLFMKENKYFSRLNFWLPIGYVFALGLFFTEDTSYTRLLHRDMTLEWKGWMQLVILVYHMTGASQVLPIYLHAKILISSYLFLLGYCHFTSYWSGGDMGIVQYLQVMIRMNMLTLVLCSVMNQTYQFYYYVPLASFWYSLFHLVMILPPRITVPSHSNSEHSSINYFHCIIKFLILGGFITIFYMSEVFFEKVFVIRAWKSLFVTADDDIHQWWNRWKLDRYSMLYGMVFGLVYQAMKQYGFIDDTSGSNLLGGRLAFLASLAAAVFSSSYAILAPLCSFRETCDEIHPYMVWVPILGYIVLRNLIGLLRTRYSTFFSWFGNIHLEMFVCQYHIWLAADTHGVLVLIPSYPVANALVTSFIFLCACHELHGITNMLVRFIAPFNAYRAVRNALLCVSVGLFAQFTMTKVDKL